jgi:MFS family permease
VTSGRRLVPAAGRPTAFWLVVYAFAVVMLGTTLPTPLYPLYEMTFGASPTVITTIFSTYAVGVIAALLLVGRLSDEIGRRPVLLPGLACSAASAVVFLLAHGVAEIYAGRILSGLSAGIFTGTATAAILDLAPDDRRGFATTVAVACNIFGLACGPLIAGVLAEWAPAPLRLPYAVDLVLLAPAVVGVLLAPETVRRRAGARLRLQRLNVPPQVRRIFWPSAAKLGVTSGQTRNGWKSLDASAA